MTAALLTFSVGPVHTFIGQARRIADLWAGSAILSDVTSAAMRTVLATPDCALIFPSFTTASEIPPGVPNRFVARVPGEQADALAEALAFAVCDRWKTIVEYAVGQLLIVGLDAGQQYQHGAWKDALKVSWSWLEEGSDYGVASEKGARLFAASRVYRSFTQNGDAGVKCAICGERNALPDGIRDHVRNAWETAEKLAPKQGLAAYLRIDQSRLCLVCSAKRLYPKLTQKENRDRTAVFKSFEAFQPKDEDLSRDTSPPTPAPDSLTDGTRHRKRQRPYFAVVTMDGDNLAKRLAGSPDMNGARMEAFQQTVSKVLSAFARDLQKSGSAELNRSLLPGAPNDPQRQPPLLIYAGGEDVLFVCDPRDAIGLASVIQQLYVARFHEQLPGETFTISAAVLFAHTGIPAGTLFRDAETLLKQKAKLESDRNSIAIALHKRSGSPAEATFRWNDDHGINQLDQLTNDLLHLRLASRQTYDFAEADRVLSHVFSSGSEWEQWLTYRLGQGEGSAAHAPELAKRLTPFFMNGQVQALRIARFIAVEIGEPKPAATTGGAS